jgi:hypothetical protein
VTSSNDGSGAGGGGADEAGINSTNTKSGQRGGNGLLLTDWATGSGLIFDEGYFAGGGASGAHNNAGLVFSVPEGGLGGGGNGALSFSASPNATPGEANSGGGGGSSSSNFAGRLSAAGGSGLVVVRYAA